MTSLSFIQVRVFDIAAGATQSLSVPSGKIWKIESAGIAGTNGTLYLKKGTAEIGILFTTIEYNYFGSAMPFWLNDSFGASILNDSKFTASVSITEWEPVTM